MRRGVSTNKDVEKFIINYMEDTPKETKNKLQAILPVSN